MNKYKRLGKNTLLVFVGNAGSKILTLLLLPFYTAWLSVEDYGVMDMLNVYVMLLLGLCTASISEAAFVFPKDKDFEVQKQYFSSGLFVSFIFLLITAFVFFLLSTLLVSFSILKTFTNNTWFIYLIIVATFFQSYFQEFNRGVNKMKVYSTSGIILTISTALFSFIFIPNYGVYGYIISMILANFCSAVYSGVLSKSYKYLSFKAIQKSRYSEMLKYSIPLIPNSMMWWFIGYFNRPLIEIHSGLKSVGILAVANKFPSAIVMLFAVFFYSWQVSVVEEFGKKNYQEFYNKIFNLMLFGLCLASIALTLSSEFIISFVTTKDFHEAWVYIPILALAPLFQSISSFSSTNFIPTKTTKYTFYASIIGGLASVVFNFILIPIWGIWGAVIAVVFSHISMSIVRVYYAWKFVHLTHLIPTTLTLLCTILISVVWVSLNEVNTILKLVLVLVLFGAIFVVNKGQVEMLVKKLNYLYGNYRGRN